MCRSSIGPPRDRASCALTPKAIHRFAIRQTVYMARTVYMASTWPMLLLANSEWRQGISWAALSHMVRVGPYLRT